MIQLGLNSAIYNTKCNRIAAAMRNETVVSNAACNLRIVAGYIVRRPVEGEVKIEAAVTAGLGTINPLVRHKVEQVISLALGTSDYVGRRTGPRGSAKLLQHR